MPPQQPRDWSEMQLDVLALIIDSLEFSDALAAAAVCPSWRAAATVALGPALTPRRVLWLAGLGSAGGETAGALLYDCSSSKSRRVSLPGFAADERINTLLGSSNGWLFVMTTSSGSGGGQMSLVNPFTGKHVPLPLPPSVPDPGGCTYCPILSGDPSAPGGHYTAILLIEHNRTGKKFLLDISCGGDNWRITEFWRDWFNMCGCITHNGMLLMAGALGGITAWDVDSGFSSIFEAPRTRRLEHEDFLLASPWGDLLKVRERFDHHRKPGESAVHFSVHRVDLLGNEMRRTKSLRGHAIIIWNDQCSLVSVDTHPALLPNCIFFFFQPSYMRLCGRYWSTTYYDYSMRPNSAGLFNLTTNAFQPLPPSMAPLASFHRQAVSIISPSTSVQCPASANESCWCKTLQSKKRKFKDLNDREMEQADAITDNSDPPRHRSGRIKKRGRIAI